MQNDKSKSIESVLGIVVGFAILHFIFKENWLLIISIVVGLLGLFSQVMAEWIHWGWMRLIKFIGFINSHILLGLIFYVFLFPIALLYRLTNKDTLQLKRRERTVYKDRNHAYVASDLENPW